MNGPRALQAVPATDSKPRRRGSGNSSPACLGAFAVAFACVYFVPGGWLAHLALVVAVPLIGGHLVGRWSAVVIAAVSNLALAGTYLFAYDHVFRVTREHNSARVALILAVQSLVSVLVTAIAVSRRRRVDRVDGPS